MGGLDGLVFCGGIGEHAAPIRARVVGEMEFMGLKLDAAANDAGQTRIGTGPVEVLVIPTDEERVIARSVADALLA
jgi:acetate kinase